MFTKFLIKNKSIIYFKIKRNQWYRRITVNVRDEHFSFNNTSCIDQHFTEECGFDITM